jgi:hypothetical protein
MAKKLLLLLFMTPFILLAQEGPCDIMLLRKRKKTVQKYYAGSNILFYTKEGQAISGNIDCIKNDSIFLTQQTVRRFQTAEGGIRFDTSQKYKLMFSLANIGSFPSGKQRGKNLLTDGTLLMLGGAGYLVLNLVNTTRQGEPPFGEDNLPKVLASAGAMVVGFLLKRAWPAKSTIGKKYEIQVLKSTQNAG